MAELPDTLDLRRRARRRLIGAIALVLALVIVPPWIMDLEPKPVATKLSVEIPSQDSSRLKPPPKPPVIEPAKPPEPAKSGEAAKSANEAMKPADAPKAGSAPKSAAAPGSNSLDARTVAALGAPKTANEPPRALEERTSPAPRPPEAAAKAQEPAKKSPEPARVENASGGAGDAFVIPLGAYGNQENVKQLQARLAKEGIQSFTEPVKTAGGEQTRVRAGPYASRDAAEKARERVKGLGIDAGNVIARQ